MEFRTLLAVLISGCSLIFGFFGLYQGATVMKRTYKIDTATDTTQMTTVIVKLENIGMGVAKIESKMCSLEDDLRKTREDVIRVDASAKQAHKRLDELMRFNRSTEYVEHDSGGI